MINLSDHYETSIVSGRDAGAELCAKLKLNNSTDEIVIQIPTSIKAVTASFFGGLLSEIMEKAGSREKFYSRVRLQVDGEDSASKKRAIEGALDRELLRVLASGQSLFE